MTLNPKQINIGVVVSSFNEDLASRLLEGCLVELKKAGVPEKNIHIHNVPGSLEIPVTAQKLAQKKNIRAVICLGAVIRGETFHFEVVSLGAAQGVMQVSLNTGKPIIFGVLTTDTFKQAENRSNSKKENKGRDAAKAALKMLNVLSKIN